jgi:SPP1 gp7 family putative phage head morphogenesis protein
MSSMFLRFMPHTSSICVCNTTTKTPAPTKASVLQTDPTRTTTVRNRMMTRLQVIFNSVLRDVFEFLVIKDALGLVPKKSFPNFSKLVNQAQEREFAFLTDAGKLEAFNRWLAARMEARVLSPKAGARPDQPWTTEYIESSYRRGLINAYLASRPDSVLKTAVLGSLTQAEFLLRAFAAPEARSKIQLLATRSLESLKGVSASMASKLNFILAQGMLDGTGPAAIAREMISAVDGITQQRAFMIARTEIIHAHAEGQLDGFAKLGVAELGVKAEWVTAGDDRVCPQCAPMEGKTFTVEEARGKIPLHPNCRCSWTPWIPPSP